MQGESEAKSAIVNSIWVRWQTMTAALNRVNRKTKITIRYKQSVSFSPARVATSLPPREIISSLKISIYDGFFAVAFVTLTGSVFLPAFMLAIGASNFQIGLLAALPLFANVAQLLGALIVEQWNIRKPLVITASGLARCLWLPATIIFAVTLPEYAPQVINGVFILVLLTYLLSSISGVAWLSWMANTVPEVIRGRYYGLRNAIIGVGTITLTLGSGYFLDWFGNGLSAFYIIFFIAIICGGISTYFLTRQKEPVRGAPLQRSNRAGRTTPLLDLFLQPLRESNFRHFLVFGVVWAFAVNAASPFYVVYVLRDLSLPYSFVASYAVLAALADFVGMRTWGAFSDRTGNKPVIAIAAALAAPLPLLMLAANHSVWSIFLLLPFIYAAGGFFFAGYNLCAANILFNIAPRERDSIFFAWWAALTGVASGIGSVAGGVLAKWAAQNSVALGFFSIDGLKVVFLVSGVGRVLAVPLLRGLREPGSAHTRQALHAILPWRGFRDGMLNLPVKVSVSRPHKQQEAEF